MRLKRFHCGNRTLRPRCGDCSLPAKSASTATAARPGQPRASPSSKERATPVQLACNPVQLRVDHCVPPTLVQVARLHATCTLRVGLATSDVSVEGGQEDAP